MDAMHAAVCVRVYLNQGDAPHGQPLGMEVVKLLHDLGCSGATLSLGSAGFGAHGRVSSAGLTDVMAPVPLVVEWIDTVERVDAVLPQILSLVRDNLIIRIPVEVVQFPHRQLTALPSKMRVADVMTRDVMTASPGTPLATLITDLIDQDRRSVPVVDAERRVVGIVTNSDLVERGGLRARVHLLRAMGADAVARELRALEHDGRTAADVMTKQVVTVSQQTSVRDVAHLMSTRHLKRLPVVDPHGRLEGIVSRADLLRGVTPHVSHSATISVEPPVPLGTVGDVMINTVPVLLPDAALPDVLDALVSTRLGRVIVVDRSHRPIGVISSAALLTRIDASAHHSALVTIMQRLPFGHHEQTSSDTRRMASATSAADLMTSPVQMVSKEASISEAAAIMLEHRRKVLPVVDSSSVLIGMVDRAGLLQALHHRSGEDHTERIDHDISKEQ